MTHPLDLALEDLYRSIRTPSPLPLDVRDHILRWPMDVLTRVDEYDYVTYYSFASGLVIQHSTDAYDGSPF